MIIQIVLNLDLLLQAVDGGAGGWYSSNGKAGGKDLGNDTLLFGSAGSNLESGGGGSGGGYYGGKNLGGQSLQFYVGKGGAGGTSYVNTSNKNLPILTDVVYIDGDNSMPTFLGDSTMTGNSNNGHAKITLISIE